eukprot:CAMPEP_0172461184 /NCGR_PEP_ID=MMETSP1065-20121228/39583_1 /TAXON_ID=265537 /ORGANISM="Amphiprora paludosa, Strain CCMP125" /LENGTH=248 /DNA_ID=CAMNT_0013216425 /DNA_START=24 /DNA_END=770 /DNA_ORIENTATION=+
MAKHLARIHGTEEDKVNCPFYFKIGACRHSDRCSRLHHKPAFSQTLLFQHLYKHPSAPGGPSNMTPAEQLEDFLSFYEDMYMELSKFGRLEGLYVADNVGDHMIGHVYAKFTDEEEATDCLQVMHGRYYNGRLILVEYSPVTDFREARCRDYDEENCQRGGYCNFLHVRPVPFPLLQSLEDDAEADRRETARQEAEARSSRKKRRREERDRPRSRSNHREEEDHHHHHRSSSDRHRESSRSSRSRRDS